MPDPGWYAQPGDPTRGRYWDGSTWTDVREGLVTPYPAFPEDEVVEPRSNLTRYAVVGLLIVAALVIGVLVWLATKDSEPEPPYACAEDITVTDWDDSTFVLNGGEAQAWPDGVDPGTTDALETVCAAAIAFRDASQGSEAAAATTTSPPSTSGPSTTRPVATTQPPVSTAPGTPDALPAGTAVPLGNGLDLSVARFAGDGSGSLTSDSGPVPTPADGSQFAVVTLRLTNASSGAVAPGPVDLELVSPSSSRSYSPATSVRTDTPFDPSTAVPASSSVTGDVVFEVPAADLESPLLRLDLPGGAVLLALG